MRIRPTILLALAALGTSGCVDMMGGGCGYESRGVMARAQISAPANPRVEYADLWLSQIESDRASGNIRWEVIGVDLQFHILSARLIDLQAGGVTILELPKQPLVGGTQAIAGGLSDYRFADPKGFERLYDLLVTGQVAIELDTDIPGRPRIRQSFRVTTGGRAWSEPSCS